MRYGALVELDRQGFLVDGLEKTATQFAMNLHGRADDGVGERISVICANLTSPLCHLRISRTGRAATTWAGCRGRRGRRGTARSGPRSRPPPGNSRARPPDRQYRTGGATIPAPAAQALRRD